MQAQKPYSHAVQATAITTAKVATLPSTSLAGRYFWCGVIATCGASACIALIYFLQHLHDILLIATATCLGISIIALAGLYNYSCRIQRLLKDQNTALADMLVNQSKLVTLGSHASSIIHDINNPLMLVQEYAGWIKDLMEDIPPASLEQHAEIVKSATKIEVQVGRASAITKRTLGFLYHNNEAKQVDITRLAHSLFDFVHTKANDKHITLVPPQQTILVHLASPDAVQQILFNLIDNAIDATPPNGTITVHANQTETDIFIAVHDTGTGISASIMEEIFSPFFSTKPQDSGTGLGLFICRALASSMNAELSVQSYPHQGTTFTLRLPKINNPV